MTDPVERFLDFVRRELSASEVAVVAAEVESGDDRLRCRLPDGRYVAVRFESPPSPEEAALLTRRLEMLASTFGQSLSAVGEPATRPSIANALQKELEALATRALAVNAIVIDAHSPVIWGASVALPWPSDVPMTPGLANVIDILRRARAEEDAKRAKPSAIDASFAEIPEEPPATASSVRAIAAVRALPAIESLRKGRHLHHVVRDADFGYIARSLGIYVLLLVFEGTYDELGAERAVVEAIPRIERLVVALPPLDPTPEPRAGVISMRRRR